MGESGSVPRTLPDPVSISCEDLGYAYAGGNESALSGVGFEVRGGEYVGIVGPNGGGKSTLLRLLNGLLAAESSTVRISGHDPTTEPFEVRRRVGMLFQNPENGLVAPFVEDDVAFGLENLGVPREEMRARVRGAIEAVGLAGYERREPHTLSGGEKQRVALAGLLALEPEILLLDEPTSMLDAAGRREVLDRLSGLRGEKTILHVTHHLEELLDADRILVMTGGKLVADLSPAQLVSDPDLLARNQLTLPPLLRLAAGLELESAKPLTPKDLARAISERSRNRTEAR